MQSTHSRVDMGEGALPGGPRDLARREEDHSVSRGQTAEPLLLQSSLIRHLHHSHHAGTLQHHIALLRSSSLVMLSFPSTNSKKV